MMAADAGLFGVRLRAYRRSARLSQEELADKSGLSERAVRNLELGRTRWPFPDSVLRLADALGLRGESRVEFVAAAGRRLVGATDGVAVVPGVGGGSAVPGQMSADVPGAELEPVRRVVPRQLPAQVRHFVGRTGELERLSVLAEEAGDARSTVVISAIGGMAGVGKTALALHFAHLVARQFPDGQLYVNLRGFDPCGEPVAPGEALGGFLDALGVPPRSIPADLQARSGLYRSLLAGKRMLIVLDNARNAVQVRPLLPGSAGCLVLVTSRNQLAGLAAADGARMLALDVLTDDEAAALVAARLDSGRVAAEPAAVAGLARLCGRLPLALAIAAARAAATPAFPLAALEAELREAGGLLDALDVGEPAASMRVVFSWSARYLSADATRMFWLLGIHPGPDISAAAAASLAGMPPPQARSVLRELCSASLLAEHSAGRYLLHDLLRAYAAELASVGSDDDRRDATGRVLDHYLHTANALLGDSWYALKLAAPKPLVTPEAADHLGYLAWFEAEYSIMLRLTGQAAAADGLSTCAWQLPWVMTYFLSWRGYWDEWAAAQRTALAAARRAADLAGQARANHSLGHACIQLGRHGDGRVHLQEALRLYARMEDRDRQAHVHICLCISSDGQQRYSEALACALQALDLLGVGTSPDLRATTLNAVGWACARVGDYQQALTWCEQARDLYQELGARLGEAYTWDSLGYAHHGLGHQSHAIDCYRRAQRLYLGNHFEYGQTCVRLGDAYHAAGNTTAARDTWQQALAILDDLHHADAAQVRAKLRRLR